MMRRLCTLLLAVSAAASEPPQRVTPMRVPAGGIQPQVAVDAEGAIHLLFYNGDPPGRGHLEVERRLLRHEQRILC